MQKYMIDGRKLTHVGHNGVKEVFFFTEVGQHVTLIEIPYDFDGIIYRLDVE